MTDFLYTFNIDQFPNHEYMIDKLGDEIRSSSIITALDYLNSNNSDVDIYFKAQLSSEDLTTLSGVVSQHNGIMERIDYSQVRIISSDIEQQVKLSEEYRDRSGKLRVHQTSRKLGLRIMWTGVGDDTSDPNKVGGGEPLTFQYKIGDTDPMIKYVDFNISDNETWVHEGYMTWKDGQMDTFTLQLVPRVATIATASGTDMVLYGGYMVMPTSPGTGNITVTSDLGSHTGGLVYMPNNDLDEPPTAFWDADWNSSTHRYENIRPSYTGTGRYNIFSYEVIFAEFIRQLPLLASGFIQLSSSDTDQIGNGMRLKLIADTNTSVEDHDWSVACIMCLHRNKSI